MSDILVARFAVRPCARVQLKFEWFGGFIRILPNISPAACSSAPDAGRRWGMIGFSSGWATTSSSSRGTGEVVWVRPIDQGPDNAWASFPGDLSGGTGRKLEMMRGIRRRYRKTGGASGRLSVLLRAPDPFPGTRACAPSRFIGSRIRITPSGEIFQETDAMPAGCRPGRWAAPDDLCGPPDELRVVGPAGARSRSSAHRLRRLLAG